MADVLEPEGTPEGEAAFDTSAAGIAVALDEARAHPSLRGEVAAFLAAQRTLTEDQRRRLKAQEGDLRLRTASDWVKLGLQGLTLVAVLAVAAMLAVMIRDAMNARGLVVEGFSTPPGFAARGLSGDALAADLASRIAAVDRFANANSLTRSDAVRGGEKDAVKLQIPETGVSLGEVDRFLRRQFGHETPLSGQLIDEGGGVVALNMQVSGSDPIVVRGPASDLDGLMQTAAEKAFQAFDPTNYVLYLGGRGREDEAYAAAQELAHRGGSIFPAAGYALSANRDGDRRRALATALMVTRLAPTVMAPWMEAGSASTALGHDEAMLAYARRLLTLKPQDQPRQQQGAGVAYMRAGAQRRIDLATGDFGRLAADTPSLAGDLGDAFAGTAISAALLHDGATVAFQLGQMDTLGADSSPPALEARQQMAAGIGDWPAALAAAQRLIEAADRDAASSQAISAGFVTTKRQTVYEPWLALSLARTGQAAAAQALIGKAPLDCYLCVRTRALVAEAAGDRAGADRWFAEAVRQGPSLPYAHLEWGEAKLARGDTAGALSEFARAHALGPNFPDVSEAWGEALLAARDPAGAVAKFHDAAQHAPNWGRLHLKWGEALARLGRADEARAQWRIAARLSLSAADRAELAAQKI